MKRNPEKRNTSGFTMVEILVVVAVFSIVAYGILKFFGSQSVNTSMQNATSTMNRTGQTVTNFMRQEMLMADKWISADSTAMTFKANGQEITYSFNTAGCRLDAALNPAPRCALVRTVGGVSTVFSPNIEAVRFNFFLGGISEVTEEVQIAGQKYEIPLPCLNETSCPYLLAIREVQVRFVVRTAAPMINSGSLSVNQNIGSNNPLDTTFQRTDGHLRRMYMIKAQSRNLYLISDQKKAGSGCGTLTITGISYYASCDADMAPASITVTTMAPATNGVMIATPENDVVLSVSYKGDTSPPAASQCADATCSVTDPNYIPPLDPYFNVATVTPSMRTTTNGVGTVLLYSPADQSNNELIIGATWTPPPSVSCATPPVVTSNQWKVTIIPGAAATIVKTGAALLSGETLGATYASGYTSISSCAGTTTPGGCSNNSAYVRVQVLDKCKNPVRKDANTVTFTLPNGSGTLEGGVNSISKSVSDNGIAGVTVYAPSSMPTAGAQSETINVTAAVSGGNTLATPPAAQPIGVTLNVCDLPKTLTVTNPSTLSIGPQNACPGYSNEIYFQIKNACGDPMTSTTNPAYTFNDSGHWNISLTATDTTDPLTIQNQVGVLTPVPLVPTVSGSQFVITYNSGGSVNPDGSPMVSAYVSSAYCGIARTAAINIAYTPVSGASASIGLNLNECPPVNAAVSVENATIAPPGWPSPLPTCQYSGVGDQRICLWAGAPNPVDPSPIFQLHATVSSCKKQSGDFLSLANVAVIFVASVSPLDGAQYPFIGPPELPPSGTSNYFFTSFDGTYSATSGDQYAYMTSGNITYNTTWLGRPLNPLASVKALICLPGGNNVRDTVAGNTACSPLDDAYDSTTMEPPSLPLDFWIGPSPAGFIDEKSSPLTFVPGRIGIFKAEPYTALNQVTTVMTDPNYDYPYGPVIQAPGVGTPSYVYFEVVDYNANQTRSVAETVTVTVKSADPLVGTNDQKTVTLTETDLQTGQFHGGIALQLYPAADSDKLSVRTGDMITVHYVDVGMPSNTSVPSDSISGRFYTTGPKSVVIKKANGADLTSISPSASAPPGWDSSNSTPASAFHIDLNIPEMAQYTYNNTSGQTAQIRLHTLTNLYGNNSDNYVFLKESDTSGNSDNNGILRVDKTLSLNGYRNYIFVTRNTSTACPNVACFLLTDSPGKIQALFDYDNQNPIVSADVTAEVSVNDVNKPVVTLDKVSLGSYTGSPLAKVPAPRVTGTVYLQGAFNDGNGTVPSGGIAVSGDGGVTWPFLAGFTPGSSGDWTYSIPTNLIPDGVYTIKIRARDTAGNYGYSNDTADGLGTFTIIVDNVIDVISINGYTGMVCDNHTFTAKTTYFNTVPESDTQVNFYVDGGSLPINTIPVTPSGGSALVTFNTNSLGNGIHSIRAVATDLADPAHTAGYTANFSVNTNPPTVTLTIPTYTAPGPLQGFVAVTAYTSGCRPVTGVMLNDYLTASPTVMSGQISMSPGSCTVTTSDLICQGRQWSGSLPTNPSSCANSAGFTGDGPNSLYAVATDAIGNTGTFNGATFNLDNIPFLTRTSPAGSVTTISGNQLFQATVVDCDGVLDGRVTFGLGSTFLVNMPRSSGTDPNGTYDYTVSTNDYPTCASGTTWFPNGSYTYSITADDRTPNFVCGTDPLNRCGTSTGSITIHNPPTNVDTNITINSVSSSSYTFPGIFGGTIRIRNYVDTCESGVNVAIKINNITRGNVTGYSIVGGHKQYTFAFDTNALTEGNQTLQIVVSYPGGSVSSSNYSLFVSNRPACHFGTISGTRLTTKIFQITGTVLNASGGGVLNQQVTITDTSCGGDKVYGVTQSATSITGGTWTITYTYQNPKSSCNYSITMPISGTSTCMSCDASPATGYCPQTKTVP